MRLTQIEILKKYKIPIEGNSGQHLLIDANIQKKIVDLLGSKKDQTVLEIGPGLGALTGEMLDRNFQVLAIEKDAKFVEILKDYFAEEVRSGQLQIMNQDVLQADFFAIKKASPALNSIISNLPYYITAPILIQTFEALSVFERAVFMMQKEVGERVVAKEGTSDYGRLSLSAYFSSEAECCFHVSPSCFTPQPKVWSSVLSFSLCDRLKDTGVDHGLLTELIRQAFGQRRKMLFSILSRSAVFNLSRESLENVFSQCGVLKQARAEELSPQTFMKLSLEMQKLKAL